MNDIPISYPARYAPGVALNFADPSGGAVQVSQTAPLPVTISATSSGGSASAPPLSGLTSAAVTVGPFAAAQGKPIVLALSGTWTGTVQLLRSTDGGVTRFPLTLGGAAWARYQANVCEPVWEESESAATFYLQLTPSSGAILYRLAQ